MVLPKPWPTNSLTTQAKKIEIVDSPDFRRAVSQKYLLVVSTSSADTFMEKSEHGKNELQRIFNKAGGQNNIAANSGGMTAKMQQIKQQSGGISIEAAAADGSSTTEQISGAVIQIINRSNSEGDDKMDVKEAMSLLVGRNLNSRELDYIIKNSVHAEIKAFASKKI